MRLQIGILFVLLISFPLTAAPKTCILRYPKECKPAIKDMQISFNCPVDKRKLATNFSITNLFGGAYMPETLKFQPHNLDHFIWECPD